MWVIDSEHKSAIQVSHFWLDSLKLMTSEDSPGEKFLVEIRASRAQRFEEVERPITLAVKVFDSETYFRFAKEWIGKVNAALSDDTILDFQAICENFER